MAEASDKYDEKVECADDSSVTLPISEELEPEREFAAIRMPSNTVSRTQQPQSLRSISRTRSNNGYGCDEGSEGDGQVESGAVEKDPYEVHWDGGENDPLNPRSLGKARKWSIVLIVSMCSLCV